MICMVTHSRRTLIEINWNYEDVATELCSYRESNVIQRSYMFHETVVEQNPH